MKCPIYVIASSKKVAFTKAVSRNGSSLRPCMKRGFFHTIHCALCVRLRFTSRLKLLISVCHGKEWIFVRRNYAVHWSWDWSF